MKQFGVKSRVNYLTKREIILKRGHRILKILISLHVASLSVVQVQKMLQTVLDP
jgi:hypothetical protein